jgi:hypothetical protein
MPDACVILRARAPTRSPEAYRATSARRSAPVREEASSVEPAAAAV